MKTEQSRVNCGSPDLVPSNGSFNFGLPSSVDCSTSGFSSATAERNGHNIQFESPRDGAVRVRRVVHRGCAKPGYRLPSIKLSRMIQCESPLELDLAEILDTSAHVKDFGEQPIRLHYRKNGEWLMHIPDFRVVTGDHVEYIEVKFRDQVTPDIVDRTKHVCSLLGEFGVRYRLLTEREIRAGIVLENARAVWMRARSAPPLNWKLRCVQDLLQTGPRPLREFGWNGIGTIEAAWVAHMIASDELNVDCSVPLNGDSTVSVSSSKRAGGALWP